MGAIVRLSFDLPIISFLFWIKLPYTVRLKKISKINDIDELPISPTISLETAATHDNEIVSPLLVEVPKRH